uniref:Uncharacterized protein n=1 Tax=Graphocephala atropunctata TaxID=36148 RepID=A0A1B6M6I8_9HEMI
MCSCHVYSFVLFLVSSPTLGICDVYSDIVDIETRLAHNISSPETGSGFDLIEDIEVFNNHVFRIKQEVKRKNKTVIKSIKELVAQEVPEFLTFHSNETALRDAFNWTYSQITALNYLCIHSKYLWDDLKKWYDTVTYGNEQFYFN